MKKVFLTIFSWFLILQSVRGFDFEESDLETEESLHKLYNRWIIKFSSDDVDRSAEEIKQRFIAFKETVNYTYTTMTKPYNHKLNKFADWTLKEFQDHYSCYDIKRLESRSPQVMKEKAIQLPDSDSCWAFAVVAAIEGIVSINTGKPAVSLSEQELVDCERKGCKDGDVDAAYNYTARNGITSEKLYPYIGITNKCRARKGNHVKIKGYKDVEQNNEKALAKAVHRQPVSIIINIGDYFKDYTGGVFNQSCGPYFHSMTVVGYGLAPNTHTDCWIVKNSYGEQWGRKGYMYIMKDISDPSGYCGIARWPSYPIQNKRIKDEL